MRFAKLSLAFVLLVVAILAIPTVSDARSRTGSDLSTRVATLETQVGSLNTLLENVMRTGNDLVINSGLNVSGAGTLGPNGEHIACFENTDGGTADGVAIQIDRAPTYSANNFMTFYNVDEYVCGRIEGFSLADLDPATSFPSVPSIGLDDFFIFCPAFISFSGGSLPSLSGGRLPSLDCSATETPPFFSCDFDAGALPDLDPGSLPSIDFKSPLTITNPLDAAGSIITWLAEVICWAFENDLESLIQTDPFGLALAPLLLAESTLCKNGTGGGVTYGSTGADYAEWLEMLDPTERIEAGQIVGVFHGKITKKTDGAEKIMAASLVPVVAGNLPPQGEQHKYKKVGFMGQVPVYVRGKVARGDYILPSGKHDGVGIAIAPENLELEHIPQVLGRAWSDSDRPGLSAVNVAIGMNTSACVSICARQAKELEELERTLEALRAPADEAQAKGGAR